MGYMTALSMTETDLPIEAQLEYHLRANHFPPVPTSMIPACIEAIDAWYDGNTEKKISLPEGVGYKGLTVAPAWAIIEGHHLEAWLQDDDYEGDI
jgi:hypothetical protein